MELEAIAVEVVGAALSVAFKAILAKLSSQDVLKYARRNKVEYEVNRWKNKLLKMNRVLDDAEERQMSEVPIKKWLDEFRDLAYDVEDMLDEFSTQVMRERVMAETKSSLSKVRKLIPTCCSCVSPRDIKFNVSLGSKMEEITQRFERLDKEKEDLNLTERAAGVVTERLETTSLVQESQVYGREMDKETLVNELLSSDSNGNSVSVVAIVGMGGLGKTTLAQLVYNNETVKESFAIKAWVCVSDEFDVFKITVKIIDSFTSSSCDLKDLDNIQKKLVDEIRGKKFLLVLDDVWNEKYLVWDALIQPLAEGGLGSKVLITTRSEKVAATAGAGFMHRLKKLNPEECLSLLALHAFGVDTFSGKVESLQEVGEQIAKKCDGLPLAAKALGGLLRGKFNPKEWQTVLNSNMWELPRDNCPLLPALRVSYHHLPPHLKRCFAYCAIFPKDYVFHKDDLILWWKAEGFLEQLQSTDFMDLGNKYFQDLLSRSFFQPSTEFDYEFVMHDLMNDLAMWISGGICLHVPLNKEIASGLTFENLRHSSVVSHDDENAQRIEKFSSSTKLRTFIALCGYGHSIMQNNAIFGNMRYLKVLCLSSYYLRELPDSVSKLKLLRHLDISFTKIRLLSESISDLLNLQILKLNGCRSLIQLPREIRKLTNLQLLDISDTYCLKEMPSGIDRLTNLQILSKFIVGEKHGLRLKELKGLSLIRGELSISRLEQVVDIQDAKEVDLKAKEGLVSLKFQWSADLRDLRALEEEKHEQILVELWPHTNLKSLEIEGYNGKHFPIRVGDSNFTNLETLTLCRCNSVSSLLPFGRLSSLRTLNIGCLNLTNLPNQLLLLTDLNIEGCSNLTNLPNELPLLTNLSIEGCSNLTNLPNYLPLLRDLIIKGCSNLTTLPNYLPLLKDLIIKGCSNLTNLPNQLHLLTTLSIEESLNLTNLLNQLPSLTYLIIKECSNLTNLPNKLPLLTDLRIEGCLNLTNLPDELPSLEELWIEGCSNLTNLPNKLPSLKELWIEGCSNLTNLPNKLPSLKELWIEGCSNLKNLSNELICLARLSIKDCSNLTNLSYQFPSLGSLSIEGCLNLTNLPNQLPLIILNIIKCSNLINLANELVCLRELSIEGCSNLIHLANELPSLQILSIKGCSNLTNLANELPSLRILSIKGCSNLTHLPNELPSLERVTIEGCSNLTNLPNRVLLLLDRSSPYFKFHLSPKTKISIRGI